MTEKKVVLYLRVSTDDKGQNPERQRDILVDWCTANGVHVIATVVDEGTSATKTNPFERPKFLEALAEARGHGAAVLVEKHDRFTRQGSHEYSWAVVEMKRHEQPVKLWVASKGGLQEQDREMVGAIMDSITAEKDAQWSRDHGDRVRSGMWTARREGKHIGRPQKKLSEEEYEYAVQLKGEGKGAPAIASAINRRRGLFERADPKTAVRKHGVGRTLVAEYLNGTRTVS